MNSTKGAPRRLDALLVERGLAQTRSRAQGLILSGAVRVKGEVVTKSGTRFASETAVTVEQSSPYVSRAGEKLAHALDDFGVEISGRDCLDAGASTGGFTDVLLQRGAARVIAVDVGYGQLDWKLRTDERVTSLERTNVRRLTGEDLPFEPQLMVADLSFISLSVALESLLKTTPSIVEAVVLVKPQFEAGPDLVGRGGVVGDPEVREQVVSRVAQNFERMSFGAVGVARAAITGRKSGNQEYPLHLKRDVATTLAAEDVRAVVTDE